MRAASRRHRDSAAAGKPEREGFADAKSALKSAHEFLVEENEQRAPAPERAAAKIKRVLKFKTVASLSALQSDARTGSERPPLLAYDDRRGRFGLTLDGIAGDIIVTRSLKLSLFEAFSRLRHRSGSAAVPSALHGEGAAVLWRATAALRGLGADVHLSMCNGLAVEAWEEVKDVCRTAEMIKSLPNDEQLYHTLHEACVGLETRADNWFALFKARTKTKLRYLREGMVGIVRERASATSPSTSPRRAPPPQAIPPGEPIPGHRPPLLPPLVNSPQGGASSHGASALRQSAFRSGADPENQPDTVLDKGVARLGTVLVKLLHTIADKIEDSLVLFGRAMDPYYPPPLVAHTPEEVEMNFNKSFTDEEGVPTEHLHLLFQRLLLQYESTKLYLHRVFTAGGINAAVVPELEREMRAFGVPSFSSKSLSRRHVGFASTNGDISLARLARSGSGIIALLQETEPNFANGFLISECATTAQLLEQHMIKKAFATASMLRTDPKELTAKGMRMVRACLFEAETLENGMGPDGDALIDTAYKDRRVLCEYCYRVFLYVLSGIMARGLEASDLLPPVKWTDMGTRNSPDLGAARYPTKELEHMTSLKFGRRGRSLCYLLAINENFHILPIGDTAVPARLPRRHNPFASVVTNPTSSNDKSSQELVAMRYALRSKDYGQRHIPVVAPLQAAMVGPRNLIERAHGWLGIAMIQLHEARRKETFTALTATPEELCAIRDKVMGVDMGITLGGPPPSLAALVTFRKHHSVGMCRIGFVSSLILRRMADIWQEIHSAGALGATSAICGMGTRALHEYAAVTSYRMYLYPEACTMEQLLCLHSDVLNVVDAADALIAITERKALTETRGRKKKRNPQESSQENPQEGSLSSAAKETHLLQQASTVGELMEKFEKALTEDPVGEDNEILDDAEEQRTLRGHKSQEDKGMVLAYNAAMLVSLRHKIALQLGLLNEKLNQELSTQAYAIFDNPELAVPHLNGRAGAKATLGRVWTLRHSNSVAPVESAPGWSSPGSDNDNNTPASEAANVVAKTLLVPVIRVLHLLDARVRDNVIPSVFSRLANGLVRSAENALTKRGRVPTPHFMSLALRKDATFLYNLTMNAYSAGEERRRFQLVEDAMSRVNAIADVLASSPRSRVLHLQSAHILPDASYWAKLRDEAAKR